MKTFISTCFLLFIAVTTISGGKLRDNQLSKILRERLDRGSSQDLDNFASEDDLSELKRRIFTLENLDDITERLLNEEHAPEGLDDVSVSKRPFCNGFTGCGRTGKRLASSETLDNIRLADFQSLHEPSSETSSISKRPFCNGFFGCGNPGKRLVFRNPSPVVYTNEEEKRFFCNPGAFGCSNRGKRSTLLDRMKTIVNSNK